MYKIHRFLVVIVLIVPFALFGQPVSKRPMTRTASKAGTVSNNRNTGNAVSTQFLHSWPMLGYSDRREVIGRAQIKKTAHVQVRYHETSKLKTEKSLPVYLTSNIYTNRQTVFTAHLLADLVEPEKNYEYDVLIEGQKASLPYPTRFQTQSL